MLMKPTFEEAENRHRSILIIIKSRLALSEIHLFTGDDLLIYDAASPLISRYL